MFTEKYFYCRDSVAFYYSKLKKCFKNFWWGGVDPNATVNNFALRFSVIISNRTLIVWSENK